MFLRISSFVFLLLPAMAMAEGPARGCLHQPESCLTELLGQPSERVSQPTIMQYDELRQRVGKYADTSPSAIAMNKGYVIDKKSGIPLPNQETLIFNNPRITPTKGSPFIWACSFHATLLDGRVNGTGVQCPRECSSGKFVAQVLTEAVDGTLPETCKL